MDGNSPTPISLLQPISSLMVVTWFQAAALDNLHENSCLIGPATYCETLHISYS